MKIKLSIREMECLELLNQGHSIKGIARELLIGQRSVETYLNRIKTKTEIFSKSDLIKFYNEQKNYNF